MQHFPDLWWAMSKVTYLNRWLCCWLLAASVPGSGAVPESVTATSQSRVASTQRAVVTEVSTPARESAQRKHILGALRLAVKKMSGLDVVFVVTHLKVGGRWAWVDADPRSADGTQHYEPVGGLLTLEGGRWVYLEGRPEWGVCEEDPDCADSARYFMRLAAKYPGLSPAIFPRE